MTAAPANCPAVSGLVCYGRQWCRCMAAMAISFALPGRLHCWPWSAARRCVAQAICHAVFGFTPMLLGHLFLLALLLGGFVFALLFSGSILATSLLGALTLFFL